MTFFLVILIAFSLAMDCLAVSVSCGMALKRLTRSDALKVGVFFGGFQSGMALVGWIAGIGLGGYIEAIDHWVAFFLLALIGGKMIFEGIRNDYNSNRFNVKNYKILLLLSIATSIDALAVGVTLAFFPISMLYPIILIGIVSFIFAIIGILAGDKLGRIFGKRVEMIGGLILIGLGIKILFEHLFV